MPWIEEPGGLQPMGSQRAGHDWAAEQQQIQLLTQINVIAALLKRTRLPSAVGLGFLYWWNPDSILKRIFNIYFQSFTGTANSVLWICRGPKAHNTGFPGESVVRNLPVMQETQETWVWSLGWEDPLEEEIATHSSVLAWRIPWTEEPGGLQSMGSQRVTLYWACTLIFVSHSKAFFIIR